MKSRKRELRATRSFVFVKISAPSNVCKLFGNGCHYGRKTKFVTAFEACQLNRERYHSLSPINVQYPGTSSLYFIAFRSFLFKNINGACRTGLDQPTSGSLPTPSQASNLHLPARTATITAAAKPTSNVFTAKHYSHLSHTVLTVSPLNAAAI